MGQETPNSQAQKLLIDRPSDFKFHVAYMAYSKAWEENSSEETRTRLNEIISALKDDEDSYAAYYASLSQYRSDRAEQSGRTSFRAQRKRAWRESQAKSARESRYRR